MRNANLKQAREELLVNVKKMRQAIKENPHVFENLSFNKKVVAFPQRNHHNMGFSFIGFFAFIWTVLRHG